MLRRSSKVLLHHFSRLLLLLLSETHSTLTLKKHTTTESKIAAYFRWNVIGPMVPDSLGRVDTCDVFKEKTKRRRRTLKKRKCWKKFFFISHFWTEKKTFWRSVVNLCFDTFFFLFYYFLFSLWKKKRKEWLQQWKWQANGRHRERPQEHTWSRVIPRRPISQAKLFCVCVEMDENEQFSSKLTDWLILTRRKKNNLMKKKKTGTFHSENEMKKKEKKFFLKTNPSNASVFWRCQVTKRTSRKWIIFRLQILDSLNF